MLLNGVDSLRVIITFAQFSHIVKIEQNQTISLGDHLFVVLFTAIIAQGNEVIYKSSDKKCRSILVT